MLRDDRSWLDWHRERCEWELVAQVRDALEKIKERDRQNILEALLQLAAGTYGFCLDCHARIPPQRLDARPFAVRCDVCAARSRMTRPAA
jgi:RNA polymerase-binding transcription factor DksA